MMFISSLDEHGSKARTFINFISTLIEADNLHMILNGTIAKMSKKKLLKTDTQLHGT